MGVALVLVCGFIFLGGVQRLAAVTEKIVPIMAGIFLLGGVVVLIARIQYLPATFGMIFQYAFQPQAIIGGTFGAAIKAAISQGAKRGLFSNEAGMGSTPHAHAQANVSHPHEQGIVAMAGVFIDTFVVLTLNALVIISTLYTVDGPLNACGAAAATQTITKANLAQTSFGVVFGEQIGAMFVAVCLFFFAFSTILSWNMFAKINVIYLFGKKDPKRCTVINKTNLAQIAFGTVLGEGIGAMFVAICLFFFAFSTVLSWNLFGKINATYLFGKKFAPVYTVIALVFIFLGTLMSNDLVWELTDAFNYLMVIPNAMALFALSGMVVKSAKEGIERKK